MLNNISIAGRVTKDPELKEVGDKNVCKFTVAVDQRGKKRDDQGKTDFFDVEVWDKTALFAHQWIKRGKVVIVTGRHESRKVVGGDHDGKVFWTLKADQVNPFIEKRDASEATTPSNDEIPY